MLVRHKFRYLIPCHDGGYPDTEEVLGELESAGGAGGSEQSSVQVSEQTPAEQPWQPPEFLMLGEERVPWDKAQTWLSQGRNYSQRAAQLNQIEQQYAPFKGLDAQTLSRFKEIDEYIRTDEGKAWWDHTTQSWQKRALPPEIDPNIETIINPLNQQISQLSETVKTLLTDRQTQQEKLADEALDAEIKATREKFPNIDFDQVDESGQTTVERVLQYAAENNLTFRAAFLDYHHDKLPQIFKAEGAAAVAAKKEQEAKKGIIGKTQTPVTANKSYDHRGKSYDDILEDAARDLGLN